jgi:hypothetical protein
MLSAMHLSDYMAANNLSDRDVAGAIARSRVSVSRYRRSLVRPGWETMEAVRRFTGGKVTPADWRSIVPRARGGDARSARVA